MAENEINAKNVYSCYFDDMKPPIESLIFVSSEEYNKYSKEVTVYYTKGLNEAKKLVKEREPTNIYGTSLFQSDKMLRYFGWGKSGYSELYRKNKELPQNIGIVCKTPVIDKVKPVYIINSIGFGFDRELQPDFIYYNSINFDKNILIEKFSITFDIVFSAAKDLNINKVVLSQLGCGAFSELYPGDFYKNIWINSLKRSLEKNKERGLPTNIGLMGNPTTGESDILKRVLKDFNIKYKSMGFVPDILTECDTLYQNAWDPHSFVGNGNFADNSLDGYMGRNTLMHFLCWPYTNQNIIYKKL